MQFITWPTFRSLFKTACFAALVSLISYWFYKFVIEDDETASVNGKIGFES